MHILFIIYMEGYIISYKNNLLSSEITNINYFLFGKVLTKYNKLYYYNGLLADIKYFKLGNGCYFIYTDNIELINNMLTNNNLLSFKVIIEDIDNNYLRTAKENKRLKYENKFVKNL